MDHLTTRTLFSCERLTPWPSSLLLIRPPYDSVHEKVLGSLVFQEGKILATCMVLLFVKMFLVGVYTAFGRNKEGRASAPEDALVGNKFSSGPPNTGDALTIVDRGQAMHRNDLENIPIFLIIAIMLYVTSGYGTDKYSLAAHAVYYTVFTATRFLHTICFLFGLQPFRTISFFVGVVMTLAAGIHLMIQVYSI